MAQYLNVAAGSDDARYRDALAFICDGDSAGFDEFGLLIHEGVLFICVYLRVFEQTPSEAAKLAKLARANFDSLLERPDYLLRLGQLPQQIAFIDNDPHTPMLLGYLDEDDKYVGVADWNGSARLN